MDQNDELPDTPQNLTESQSPGSLRKIRLIFVATLAVLFVNYVLMACTYEEPYPSLMMPGFRGSSSYQAGKIVLKRCDIIFIDENNRELSVSLNKLLEDFPPSHRGTIKLYFFKPPSESRRPPSKLMQRALDMTGNLLAGFRARHIPRDSTEQMASLREWLQRRAIQLFPEDKISKVEFRWYQSTFNAGDNEHEFDRESLPSWSIPLESGQPEPEYRIL